MDGVSLFLCYAAIFVGGIIVLRIFFTLWGVVDRKLHPDKVENALQSSFKSLKNKTVSLCLKDGSRLDGYTYRKCLYFDVSDYGSANLIYFEFTNPEDHTTIIAGADIRSITST